MTAIAYDPRTKIYIDRRMNEGRDAMRCLKRYVAHELYAHLPRQSLGVPMSDFDVARAVGRAAMTVLLAVAAEMRGGVVLDAVWRHDRVATAYATCPDQ